MSASALFWPKGLERERRKPEDRLAKLSIRPAPSSSEERIGTERQSRGAVIPSSFPSIETPQILARPGPGEESSRDGWYRKSKQEKG
jgi:hypothetical protein